MLSGPIFLPQFFASYIIDFRVNGSEDQSELVRGGLFEVFTIFFSTKDNLEETLTLQS